MHLKFAIQGTVSILKLLVKAQTAVVVEADRQVGLVRDDLLSTAGIFLPREPDQLLIGPLLENEVVTVAGLTVTGSGRRSVSSAAPPDESSALQ